MKTTIDLSKGTVVTRELSQHDLQNIEDYNINVRPGILRSEMRIQRDRLLEETDRFALSDRVLSEEMRVYRQALRDLPANTSDFENVTWPDKPAELG